MNWSFPIAKVKGIEIRVHFTFALVLLWAAFDWGHGEVREYYLSLLREACRRYDLDGVEFDWGRTPPFFRREHRANRPVMTDFFRKARQACEEFIRRYPEDPQASDIEFLMGKLAYLDKDFAGAVGQLDGFRKRYPEHPQAGQAMMLAGLSQMADGNTAEAIARFTEVIRQDPDSELAARSKFLIGYTQVSSQQYASALETFTQLIEQFPQSQYTSKARDLVDRLRKVAQ